MKKWVKKGVSPVVATVLLVSIAVVLAVIIFFWAKSFIGESVEKEGRAIEKSCEEVNFIAEVQGKFLAVQNNGDVPIYGVEIRKKSIGSGEIKGVKEFQKTISMGETDSVDISEIEKESGDIFLVVPILLGETGQQKKQYVCDKAYGVEAEV